MRLEKQITWLSFEEKEFPCSYLSGLIFPCPQAAAATAFINVVKQVSRMHCLGVAEVLVTCHNNVVNNTPLLDLESEE